MARPKKYKISLTNDKLKMLKSVMHKKKTSKTVRNRCQIILDYDEAEIFIFELRKAFMDIFTEKKKQIDIVKVLKKMIKKSCYTLDDFFIMNITKSNFKETDEIKVFVTHSYRDEHLNFLNRFINRETSYNEFDSMFFKEYIEFMIKCFSNKRFIELFYGDKNNKDRVKNTFNSIDFVAKLNHNIIKYSDKITEAFESDLMQEERVKNYANYKKVLKSVLGQYNIEDFGIDVDGKLVYKNNELFYKMCEVVIQGIEG